MPVPFALLDVLDLVHGIREVQGKQGCGKGERLWSWRRATTSRRVHEVMTAARLTDPASASPMRVSQPRSTQAVALHPRAGAGAARALYLGAWAQRCSGWR